jgi:hypothetical protein
MDHAWTSRNVSTAAAQLQGTTPSAPARDLDRRQRSDVKSDSFESLCVVLRWPRKAGRTASVVSLYLLITSLYGTASPSTQRKGVAAISKILSSSIRSSVRRRKLPLSQLSRVNPGGPGDIYIYFFSSHTIIEYN